MAARLAVLAVIATLGFAGPVAAQYYEAPPGPPPMPVGVLPPYETATIVRSMGYEPIGRPRLIGNTYVLTVLDDDDLPARVILDARTGAVLTVRRAAAVARPYYGMMGTYARRGGEYVPIPPQSIPPTRYGMNTPGGARPPVSGEPATTGALGSKPAAYPPLPRPRPDAAGTAAPATTQPSAPAPQATLAVPDDSGKPGKSIPAPVAPSAKANAPAGKPEAATPAPATLVPVVPLY